MRTLTRIESRFGEILVIEDVATGARRYYEGTAFQSHAAADGESCFVYVHIMCALLRRKRRVLLLGCGGGSLATMVARRGAEVTLVDHNPHSFEVARDYFGLPQTVRCVAADFRDFLADEPVSYDAIGVDVGNATFDFQKELDVVTGAAIRGALAPNGVAVINTMVSHDLDPTADLIAVASAGPDRPAWIFDQLGEIERNAIVAIGPTRRPRLAAEVFPEDLRAEFATWSVRPARARTATSAPRGRDA
ncbi:MAG: methyltransferase domain-containing protein [Phyllobacteriaceae bacterium]|nr:methyltransferase domain-containing protein [Phyllobacteriaceae bacterium]